MRYWSFFSTPDTIELHTGRGHEMYATLGHVGHELMGKGGADSAEVVLLSVRVRPFVYLDVF